MNTKRVIQYFATIAATGDLAKKKDSKMKVWRGERLALLPLLTFVFTSEREGKGRQTPASLREGERAEFKILKDSQLCG